MNLELKNSAKCTPVTVLYDFDDYKWLYLSVYLSFSTRLEATLRKGNLFF